MSITEISVFDDIKTITFYVDRSPLYQVSDGEKFCNTFVETCHAVDAGISKIHTTSLVNLNFYLQDKGYRIFVVKNGIKKEFYPGMDNYHNKDIRKEHNLMKLLVNGFFDNDFVK